MTIYRLGLIGYPLNHSLSPKIHIAALQSCGLQGHYSLYPIHPDDGQGLKDLLARVRSGELQGLNITIPHKQNVIQFLDELTPTAKSIGAVNTIYVRNNKLIGDNTDAAGFLKDLSRFLHDSQSKIENPKSAIVLGAGGSARAVVYALANDGWNVNLVARRIEQAQKIANTMKYHEVRIVEYSQFFFHPSLCNLLVNTTPLGMTPDTNLSPLPENVCLPQRLVVYDLIYNPRETKLVKTAHSQGLQATTGLGMLIEQAALAFELWTGRHPPRNILWSAVEN